MTPSLVSALRQIRVDLADRLEPLALKDLCRSLGCRWRDRILDPVTTIHLFLLQILHRNTACAHLPRLTGLNFTASAYCQARSRLPLAILQALLRRLVEACQPLIDTVGTWHGHRTWLVDGTGVSMPDTQDLQRGFGQPTNQAVGCGFPVARVLALFHAGTGLIQHFITALLPRTRCHASPCCTRNSAPATSWSATAPSAPSPTWPCSWAAGSMAPSA